MKVSLLTGFAIGFLSAILLPTVAFFLWSRLLAGVEIGLLEAILDAPETVDLEEATLDAPETVG